MKLTRQGVRDLNGIGKRQTSRVVSRLDACLAANAHKLQFVRREFRGFREYEFHECAACGTSEWQEIQHDDYDCQG